MRGAAARGDVGRGRQASFTFSARGPLGPSPFSKVTACPSRRASNRVPLQADWWKKYSEASPAAIKPKPFSLTSRLIVPFIEVPIGHELYADPVTNAECFYNHR